ncbi:MAG: hypothetical protein EOO68_29820, partial [Moraxellaceae bacterium]
MIEQRLDKDLYQRIFNMQINETQQQQSLQLTGAVILILLAYLFYQQSSMVSYQYLTTWCMVSTVLVAISAIINVQLNAKTHKLKGSLVDLYLQINAFTLGLIFAFGQMIMGLQLISSPNTNPIQADFYVFDTIMVFVHVLGLISLTIRIRCFYLLVLTSMAPLLAMQMSAWPTFLLNDPFFLINDIYILFILFCGHRLYKTRDRLTWLVIRNDNLVEHAEHQRSITE